MKQAWQRYRAWFAARNRREQVIVFVAVLAGILMIGYTYGVEPALLGAARDARATGELAATSAANRQAAAALRAQGRDPDAAVRAELEQLRAQLAAQAERFQAVERSLVPPEKMGGLLESLLARSRGLQLVSLQTLPPTPVLEQKTAATAAPGAAAKPASPPPPAAAAGEGGLYKHGVELKVSGTYAELVAYLAELESAPQRLIWGRLDLVAEQYPRSQMTLTVYTLSLESSWLIL